MTGSVGSDDGSAIIEGVAAIAIAFLLLTLVVQVATAVTARSVAVAAAAASARRAAMPDADLGAERERLERLVSDTVPGAHRVRATIKPFSEHVRARVTFRWIPPGPDLAPFTIRVQADAPLVFAP
jgi:hypothetical protein